MSSFVLDQGLPLRGHVEEHRAPVTSSSKSYHAHPQADSETSEDDLKGPQDWKTYASSFSLPTYEFAPTDQLDQQLKTWSHINGRLDFAESEPETDEDLDLSSSDEADYSVQVHQEHGGITEDAVEDIELENYEYTENPTMSHGLPLPPRDFQPLRGQTHTRSWHFPSGFGDNPRVNPPRRCTDQCRHSGESDFCVDSTDDTGRFVYERWDLPLLIFQQYFTREILEIIASNTNQYAASQNAGQLRDGQRSHRPWKDTSVPQIMIWLGLIVYMSVIRLTRVEEYWSKNGEWPKHCIMRFQGYNRFSNIKSFFHLSPPSGSRLPMSRYYEKLELVASLLRARFQAIITPATSVSIDEIIVRFTGRSKHTIMMRGKPYPVGYNILALCEAGYCYGFQFSSPVTPFFSEYRQILWKLLHQEISHQVLDSLCSLR